ncbi:MAG TPA: hypothetical protein VFE78_30125, partial [Gemmataceae bacterium]|nr:hypothetical protein [Gemmataceae bacterium]
MGSVRLLRRSLRDGLFSVFRRVLATDDGRAMVTASARGLLHGRPPDLQGNGRLDPPPYPDLGAPQREGRACRRSDVILITGRFRSGSTLLWNLFRNVPGCTAYYEPLNERRWFDPATRGSRVDRTHR